MATQRRWYEWIPELVLIAGLTVFLVDETDAATSAFKSGRAVALMAAGVGAWIVGRVVLNRLVPRRPVRTAVFGIAALAALAIVVLSAYDDETVVEAFPTSSPAPRSSAPPVSPPASPATSSSTVSRPAAPDVASSAPATRSATAAPTPTTTPPPTTTTSVPTGPVRLRSGAFSGIDHRAAGTVAIFRAADGRHVIGLEEFDIQPGPDYDVFLVPGVDRRDPDGGTRLDDLRGNRGTQYYEVPSDVDVAAGEWTVLVWCQTFGVPVANATPV